MLAEFLRECVLYILLLILGWKSASADTCCQDLTQLISAAASAASWAGVWIWAYPSWADPVGPGTGLMQRKSCACPEEPQTHKQKIEEPTTCHSLGHLNKTGLGLRINSNVPELLWQYSFLQAATAQTKPISEELLWKCLGVLSLILQSSQTRCRTPGQPLCGPGSVLELTGHKPHPSRGHGSTGGCGMKANPGHITAPAPSPATAAGSLYQRARHGDISLEAALGELTASPPGPPPLTSDGFLFSCSLPETQWFHCQRTVFDGRSISFTLQGKLCGFDNKCHFLEWKQPVRMVSAGFSSLFRGSALERGVS
ncbi:uncharacterized protein LOC134553989 isoform X2 [Prinia subflava]|uniref:uncharacterized protein LOC134553989 isoform X2 n=1 Tax=Prinia subflava TaxID=208062 RepID=UPI002FE1C486